MIVAQRAELEDLDHLVVEAVAALAEEHRAGAVELDGERGRGHQRQQGEEDQAAGDAVEGRLDHHVPVGDRLVEDVEHRNVADVGIGARAEAQLAHVRGEPHVDRQHPQLAHHVEHALFGGQRQRHQDEVDAGAAGELDQVVDRAELGNAGHHLGAAVAAAVVEHAADAQIRVGLVRERAHQRLALAAAADDDHAPHQPPGARPAPHQRGEHQPVGEQRGERRQIPAGRPAAREGVVELDEEGEGERDQEHQGPGERRAG